MALKEYIISGIVGGLFILAFMSFIMQAYIDNDKTNELPENINILYTNITTVINNSDTYAKLQQNSTFSDQTTYTFGDIILTSITGTLKNFINFFNIIYESFFTLLKSIGINPLILSVFISIIIIIGIFYLWRNIRTGI